MVMGTGASFTDSLWLEAVVMVEAMPSFSCSMSS